MTAPSSLSRRAAGRARTWMLIGALMATTVAVGAPMGFSLAWKSWAWIGALVGALLALSWFYANVRKVDDGRIAETLHETAILAAYGPPAAALSYIVVGAGLPLMDGTFAALDRSMGFDWQFRVSHPH